MKRTFSSILSLLLALTMLLGTFASCAQNAVSNETTGGAETTGGTETENTEETKAPDTSNTESEGTSGETEKPDDNKTEDTVQLTGAHATLISASNELANGVQAYFPDASRTHYSLENKEMVLNYARSNQCDQLVESIRNLNGMAYVQNTMDVFVRMTSGDTYYASQSNNSAEVNLYRFGYYYYEGFFESQDFVPKTFEMTNKQEIDLRRQFSSTLNTTRGKDGSAISFVITDESDPQFIYGKDFNYSTENAKILVIKAKAIGSTSSVQLYVKTDKSNYNSKQTITFNLINDGEYHTYYISLFNIADYDGTLKGIRFDPAGGVGDGIAIESMELGTADLGDIPQSISINRHFHVYSDKMHHAVQFAVTEKTENIAEVGMLTEIAVDTVSKIVIVTEDGSNYDSLDAGFSWDDVVAIGFDVTEAGIFGFILPKDDIAGKLSVELRDGKYVIEQTRTPSVDGVSGVIIPSIDTEKKDEYGNYIHATGVKNNGNDFYLGQRIYTDASHGFEEFLHETYLERNPLDSKRVSISASESDGAAFLGYDAMRGIYSINIASPSGGFSTPYNNPNLHFRANFTIRSDIDRNIYIMSSSATGGTLECATLMDENLMLLPVPIEVIKNFSEATGERNLYNIGDPIFSEAIFYLPLEQNKKQEYTIVNLYQNWGNYPLKQLSQIPFHCPYYHLSTGVTETNCILPWFGTANVGKSNSSTLPDFRSMSAPFWKTQPQHNSSGQHTWISYTDSEGSKYYAESKINNITSYGPTYAELEWECLSDDGKIKITYTHMEMPQTDENRSYYTMEYEFLDDLTINSFKDNFQFYDITDNNAKGSYKKIGYLNEQNQYIVIDSNQDPDVIPEYILGDECPYFSFFMMPDWDRNSTSAEGYANVAFLIYDSEFVIGGTEKEYSFLIKNRKDHVALTLNETGTVEFKAGDKITINFILMPWGSQELEDDPANRLNQSHATGYTEYTYSTVLEDGTLYMDKNVRDVRENTLLNPLTVTSETDEIIESPFLPRVKSKDGKTAEFTLSGGENNVTVRVYGFEKLTAPKVEEFVNGEWVEYVLSSKDTPDVSGNLHYYDGYMVNYDGDGTYSYSFVTTMYEGAPRRFRISAADDFTYWPPEPEKAENENLLDVYIDHEELDAFVKESLHMYGQPVINEDEVHGSYTSVYVKTETGEAFSTLLQTEEKLVSGQYFVIKYRVPSTNKENVGSTQIWASTFTINASEAGSFNYTLKADGEWHVDIIDLSKTSLKTFKPDNSGEYMAQLLRIDIFNKEFADETTHVDIAYIGIDSNILDICDLERENFKTVTLVENGKNTEIDTITGEKFVRSYIDPSSGYTQSTLAYSSILDHINGVNANINSSSKKEGIETRYGVNVSKTGLVTLNGWAMVDGGIEDYAYSIDDGKTWIKCNSTVEAAGSDIVEYIKKNDFNFTDLDGASLAGGRLISDSGRNIIFDLSGQNGIVDIIFAAVPKADTNTLVLLYCFENVNCSVESVFDESSAYAEINLTFGSQLDSFNDVARIAASGSALEIIRVDNLSTYVCTTEDGTTYDYAIKIKGWAMVDGGVSKYVWTADGGKTWNDCAGHWYEGNDAMIVAAGNRTDADFGDAKATKKNGGFQGKGVIIDLSSYKDSTEPLDIYFCAVPDGSPDRVVILYLFEDVTIAQ